MSVSSRIFAPILVFLVLTASSLRAAPIAWDGGGDGVSFSDPANWSGDAVPGGGDHAIITLDGTYTIRLAADISLAGLTLGGASGQQTLDAGGHHLVLGTDSSRVDTRGQLIVGGASDPGGWVLTIDGPLLVLGRMDWTNGTIYANTYYLPPNGRVITIGSGGVMRWTGPGERRIQVTLDIQGTLRWEEGVTRYDQGYAHVNSGTFEIDLANDAAFTRAGINSQGPWVFTNTGTIRKTGAGTATIQVELRNIGGTVDVQQDTLLQNYISRWENTTVSVAAGATLQLTANREHEPHTVAGTLSGDAAGAFLVTGIGNGYYTTLTGDRIMGGIVDIGGTGIQIRYATLGGVYDPPTQIYSPAPTNRGLMRLVGPEEKSINGAFVNEDTLRWEAGTLVYYVTASFTNKAMFEMAIDAPAMFRTGGINGGRPGPFLNTATVLKTGGGQVNSLVDFHTIGGLVDVREGAIVQEDPSRWEDANVAISAGATLQLAGYFRRHTISGVLRGDPQGTLLVSGLVYSYSTLLLADTLRGGRLEIGGTGMQVNDANLGYVNMGPPPVNGGLLRFVGENWQYVNGNLRNEGTMLWESGNINVGVPQGVTITNAGLFEIRASGGYFTTEPSNLVNETGGIVRKVDTGKVELRGNVTNMGRFAVVAGTITSGTYYSRFTSTSTGILAGRGTLDLSRIQVDNLRNDGTTAPGPGDGGEGIGTLTILGPMPEHRFEFELAGTDSAQYDRLIVRQGTPDISLDTAAVSLTGGFTPVAGNMFDVVAGPVVGQLRSVITTPSTVRLFAIYPPDLVRLVLDTAAAEESIIQVIAPAIAARQGEIIDLPVTVIAPSGARKAGATQVTVTLRFNSTMLGPIETTSRGRIDASQRIIDLSIPLSSSGDTTIARYRMAATLGNDSVTALMLDSAASNGTNVSVVTLDGRFTLLDLCREGGPRLLNPDAVVAMSKVRPNPIADNITFDIDLIEQGATKIMVCDLNGAIVRTFIDEPLRRGLQTIRLDASGLANGQYFIVVQTPTIRLVEQVEVIR